MSAQINSITGNVLIHKKDQLPRKAEVGDTVGDEDNLILKTRSSKVEYTCDNGDPGSQTTKGIYGLNILCSPIPSPLSITARRIELLTQLVNTQQELAAIRVIEEQPEAAKQLLENALISSQELGDADLISILQVKIMEL